MMILLQVAAGHVVNIDEVLYWLGAILTITAVVTAIILPLRKMLKKYDVALKDTAQTLDNHAEVNAQYQLLIDESKADRLKLNADIAAIKRATLSQIKLEINKIASRSIARGFAWSDECDIVEMLFEAYQPLGGNGVTAGKVAKMRTLPMKYNSKQNVREATKDG